MEHEIKSRAFDFTPASIDEEARTVELLASTGAAVVRHDFEGQFSEVLQITTGAIDLGRVDGMPLLDSHRQDGLDKVLGVVRGARLEGGQLIVRVQISERHDPVWKDIKAGIIRNVSIGYLINEFKDALEPVSRERVRTITKWTLLEVSLVPVPSDASAKVRSNSVTTAQPTPPAPAPAAPPPAVQTRAQVNGEIRALGETFNIEAATINDLIDREVTVEQARSAILDAMRTRQNPAPAPRVTLVADNESPEAFVTRAAEGLYARSNPAHKLSDAARPYANLSMVDLARESLRIRSVSTTGLSAPDIVKRALQTTSDFPLLLGGAANREVRAAYEAAPATLKNLARQTTAADFRAKNKLQLSEAPTLEKVNEAGEFKSGALAEGGTSYKIDTYGKIIGLSRQAIVNDDLGAFRDLARIFGLSAAEFEAQFLVTLLESGAGSGPVFASDGVTLFHASHGNKAASGAAPAEATLSAARTAMRKQKGLSGKPINVPPKFLLVPPELETSAEKLLATVQPKNTADVNPFGGKLDLAVEARLSSATRWYLIADTAAIDGLEYAYLAGEEGPQVESRAGFEVDGVEIKCRLDFGAAFLDWRGWYMNAGA